MDGKPIRTEWLDSSAFGNIGKSALCHVFEANVTPVNGGEIAKMEVYEVPKIARFPNVQKMEYVHLKNLGFCDVTDRDDLETDMLVGAGNLWQIQKDGKIRGEPGEPIAIETTLGWTISGPISGPSDQRASVSLVIKNGDTQEHQDLKQLWDLEMLRIKESDDAYEDLVDNIHLKGERYSVKLPWKAGHGFLLTNYELCRS